MLTSLDADGFNDRQLMDFPEVQIPDEIP